MLRRSFEAILYLGLLWSPTVARADWLNDATFSCSDPIVIRNQQFMLKWLDRPAAYTISGSSSGRLFVEISQKEFNEKNLLFAKSFEINRKVFNGDDASIFKLYLQKRERTFDFPFWSQQTPAFAGLALNAAQGLVFGTAFAVFFEKMGASKANISALEMIVVDGGSIAQLGSFDAVNGNIVLTESVQYEVKIGNETRTVALFTCLYPASVKMRKVATKFPPNNPKIFEDTGSDWVMRNADTGNIERRYTKTTEDAEFYFLKEVGGFGSEIRLSRNNGPIERKNGDLWQPLYSKSEVQ